MAEGLPIDEQWAYRLHKLAEAAAQAQQPEVDSDDDADPTVVRKNAYSGPNSGLVAGYIDDEESDFGGSSDED